MLEIPQVEETWAYWDTLYGLQNEWGLSMGEATSTARTVGFPHTGKTKEYGYNYMGIADMTKIGLERCKTARCAIKVMGDLAVKYGFYSEDSGTSDKPGYADSSESLGIVDATPGEAWIFHVMTGARNKSAIWAAARIPDDHVSAAPNSFIIRKMRLDDPDNFMYSENIKDLALANGWWSDQDKDPQEFDFFGTYGSQATEAHQKSVDTYYSGRRIWRIFNLLSPTEGAKLDPAKGNFPVVDDPYPMSVPAEGVTVDMVFTAHRDHYEGTPFDLTKGMAAGPFGNPNRGGGLGNVSKQGNWERALSMQRTAWSYVCVARPKGLSLMWYGQDAPHGTAYLPLYAADDFGPPSFSTDEGTMSKF
jgi:dipeptidase